MIDFENGYVKLGEIGNDKVGDDIKSFLIQGEQIEKAYKSVRDLVVFTNMRVIAVNVQGMTGKKRDYTSLPYNKMTAFSVETSGVFDLDSELEIYMSGIGRISFEFTGRTDIADLGRLIAARTL